MLRLDNNEEAATDADGGQQRRFGILIIDLEIMSRCSARRSVMYRSYELSTLVYQQQHLVLVRVVPPIRLVLEYAVDLESPRRLASRIEKKDGIRSREIFLRQTNGGGKRYTPPAFYPLPQVCTSTSCQSKQHLENKFWLGIGLLGKLIFLSGYEDRRNTHVVRARTSS